ncbi:MAG: hypothetical protein WA633_21110 [Stellaceae bacterium]
MENFRIIAICESEAEPWFEDARVKTCATILQRCSAAQERLNSLIKFVQFKIPLAQIVSEPAESAARFPALDALRSLIEDTDTDFEDNRLRIIVKKQEHLWQEGVRASRFLSGPLQTSNEKNEGDEAASDARGDAFVPIGSSHYTAGKWGRYVRAPDFHFEVMREFGF